MTGPDGYELSDRWQESQMLMRMVRELWQRLEQEALQPAGARAPALDGQTRAPA